MYKFVKYNVLILIMFAFIDANADSINARTSIDTNDVLIGDWISLTLSVDSDSSANYIWPQIADTLNGLEVISRSIPDTTLTENHIKIKQRFSLTSFDSGTFVFPGLQILERIDGLDSFKYHNTMPMELRFATVEVDTAEAIKDIKAPLTAPWTFEEMLPYILYTLLGILLIGAAYYLWKKRKPKEEEHLRYDPKIPPHVLALEGLNNLFEKNLWQKGEIKRYHTILTEIIRLYIERRFNVLALEMVSEDILKDLRAVKLDEDLITKLSFIFSTADLVKFAKSQPISDENSRSMDYAVEFIKATIPTETEIPEKSSDSKQNGGSDNE